MHHVLVVPQRDEDLVRRCIPQPQPDRLGRRAVKKRKLPEIRVLRDDHESVLTCVCSDLVVGRNIESDLGDVAAVRELVSELADQMARQVLIEEESHAGVARRRSRIAAKPIAART